MIKITINDQPVDWRTIGCHFRKDVPKDAPKLVIQVDLTEKALVAEIERMVEIPIQDPEFSPKALSHNHTTFNLVNYILTALETETPLNDDPYKWVVSTISDVGIDDQKITVTAKVRPFVKADRTIE